MAQATRLRKVGPPQAALAAGLTESLKNRAYELIKHHIITCQFKPGEELSESQVAAFLKLGRTPVHQAFDRLNIDGLVDVLPRRGVVVRPVDLGEVIEIIEARLLNESFAVRLAAERASSAEIVAIRNVLLRADAAIAANDVEQMMWLDRELHQLIARAAHNNVLADILLRLHERSLRLWFISLATPDRLTSVRDQHHEVFAAISHRDADGAEKAMRAHIDSFRRNVLNYL